MRIPLKLGEGKLQIDRSIALDYLCLSPAAFSIRQELPRPVVMIVQSTFLYF